MQTTSHTAAPGRVFGASTAYGLMIGLAALGFLLVRWLGGDLTASEMDLVRDAAPGPAALSNNAILHVFVALTAVILTGRALGWLFARLRQPPVIGEVMAGILLGPSLLGREVSGWLLPASVAPYLEIVAQLGVVLYMFLIGLELNGELLRRRATTTLAISHASIVAPFLLGAGLSLLLYPVLSHRGVSFTSFSLFMGVAMSITAFPVLARILTDLRWQQTELGVIALGAAAIGDATAWCLLAVEVAVVQSQVGAAAQTCALAFAFIVGMLVVIRPLAERWARRMESRSLGVAALAGLLAAVLAAAALTEAIGIHAIFGAFLVGAIIPHDSRIAREATERLHDIVTVLLLPAFFALTGMRTEIGLVSGWQDWMLCGLIILAATAGKFGGAIGAARYTGMPWRDAWTLGALMNTRGLMELIVLNVGLDLGVISPTLFAMMVLMALVTTLMTTPIVLGIQHGSRAGMPNVEIRMTN